MIQTGPEVWNAPRASSQRPGTHSNDQSDEGEGRDSQQLWKEQAQRAGSSQRNAWLPFLAPQDEDLNVQIPRAAPSASCASRSRATKDGPLVWEQPGTRGGEDLTDQATRALALVAMGTRGQAP